LVWVLWLWVKLMYPYIFLLDFWWKLFEEGGVHV
jgi:hypothetical protein